MLSFAEYSVRPITESDLSILLEWRNSDRIHSEMLTTHKITREEHYNWFKINEALSIPMHLIFQYRNRPVGYVGFTDCDDINQRCSIGSYLGEINGVPVDAGVILDYLGITYLFKYTNFNKVWSYVFLSNKRACKLNKFIGYTEEGLLREHFWKNNKLEDVYVFAILRSEWHDKKKFITTLYGGNSNE